MANIRTILELLYFISGPVIAIAAILALRQLSVTRELARKAAMRDAYRLAAEQCRYYLDVVIPALDELDRLIDEKKVTYLSDSRVRILPDGIEVQFPKSKSAFDSLVPVASHLVAALNRLEAFAVVFTSQVAADAPAFQSVGATFVHSVRRLLPAVIGVSHDGKHYQSILRLFKLWNDRLEVADIGAQKEALENQLGRLKVQPIKPIGTE